MRLLSELDQLDDDTIAEAIAADADAITPDRDPTRRDHDIIANAARPRVEEERE